MVAQYEQEGAFESIYPHVFLFRKGLSTVEVEVAQGHRGSGDTALD